MMDPTEVAITVLMARGVHLPVGTDKISMFRRRRLLEGYFHEARVQSRFAEAIINGGLKDSKGASDAHRMMVELMLPIQKSMTESMQRAARYMEELDFESELSVGVDTKTWHEGRVGDQLFGQWQKVKVEEDK